MPCHCPQGYGLYRAGTGSAVWYFPGPTDVSPPRVLNITIGGSDGQHLVARHAALDGNRGNRSCPFVFEVAEGLVMGVKSPSGGRPSPHKDFPIWATILLAVAGVLVLGGTAFVVIRVRSASASSSSSTSASRQRRRRQQGGRKREEGEEVASLQDPLLLGEEGKANEGRA